MQEPLDQPIVAKVSRPSPAPPGVAMLRYAVTLLLFPAALLRLRSGEMDLPSLLTGGIYSSAQFLLAGLLFVGLRLWRRKGPVQSFQQFALITLRTSVDLVILVGVLQVLYQFFYMS